MEKDLLSYFKSNYINGRFPIDCWNLLDVPVKTNNWLESFHSMINRLFKFNHPPVWELSRAINTIIENERIKYFEVVEKKHLPRQKKQQVNKQIAIWQVISKQETLNDGELLDALIDKSPLKNVHFEDTPESEKKKSKVDGGDCEDDNGNEFEEQTSDNEEMNDISNGKMSSEDCEENDDGNEDNGVYENKDDENNFNSCDGLYENTYTYRDYRKE